MTKDLQYRFIQVALAVIAAASFYFLYLILQPAPSFDVEQPIPILNENNTVAEGDVVEIDIKYCAEEQLRSKVEVSLVNQENQNAYTVFTLSNSQLEEGCSENIFPLDSNRFSQYFTPTGDYKVRFSAEVVLNPIKTVSRQSETEEFKFISED